MFFRSDGHVVLYNEKLKTIQFRKFILKIMVTTIGTWLEFYYVGSIVNKYAQLYAIRSNSFVVTAQQRNFKHNTLKIKENKVCNLTIVR